MAAACTQPPTTPGGTNLAPTASISATPDSGAAPLEVEFSSAGSVDPDGSIASYEWNFGDGSPVETDADVTHTYTAGGTYTATLKVTDDKGASGTATAIISVVGVNAAPTAVISADPTTGKAPLAVDFDGTGSTDSDGTIVSYAWDFGGATSTDPTPTHVFTAAGPHVVTLTVTDDGGATATETTTIDVVPNVAPVAAASATPTSGKAPLAVAFSSAGSDDADGSIVGWSWSFGDGGTSTAANPNHVYAAAGSYTATLTVTDDSGATDSTTVSVTAVANVAPTAVANSNVTGGQAPLTVHFSSAGSTDTDGGIVSTAWTFGDGNGSSAANPSYTYGTPGTYTATLTVADAEGATSSSTISIQVDAIPNEAPTAVAAATPTTRRVGLPIAFSSAGSADTDGTIASYHWDFADGTSANTANPSKSYSVAGTYVAVLTVTDNAGGTATASVEVTITPNAAPTAVASGTPTTGTEPLLVQFSSAGSVDTDGTIASYAWDFGDGGSSTSANPSRLFTAPGTYEAELTVTDDFGVTDTATVTVVVIPNQVPTAAINASPQSGPRPLAVSFDGTSSSDPEGTNLTYAWDFGDGGVGTGATPSHTYAVGSYTATLVVTDAGGKVSTPASIAITVYVDDDGDGSVAADDCNDADATTYPGAPDALDSSAKDTNCDGVDGVLADTVFVQAPGGSDSGSCGTLASPCASIGQGVTNAVAGGRTVVQVVSGTYAAFNLNSTTGVTVRGGYEAGFTSRSGATTVNGTVGIASSTNATLLDLTINGTSGGASTGVLVTGGSAALTRVTVDSGTPSGAGNSAYGVRAISGASVSVTDSTITAKPGVAGTTSGGAPGAAGQGCTGSNGAGASGPSSPGNGAASCGGSGNARSGAGGRGGSYSGGGANGEAGGGGAGGGAGGGGTLFGGGSHAGGGGGGAAGGAGGAGSGGSNATSSAGALWSGINGGGGGNASVGHGGGGGGGGRSASASGGGGGAGGGGGNAGAGSSGVGIAGGGSFGVYAHNSSATVTNSVVTAGAGGTGGNGAAGGAGGRGGNGTAGGGDSCCEAGSGGGGGAGGGGGGGGGAGGGAGGPSISVFHLGTGTASVSGGTLNRAASGGAGGSGGGGGAGGGAGTPGPSGDAANGGGGASAGQTGATGNSGAAGIAVRVWNNGATTS